MRMVIGHLFPQKMQRFGISAMFLKKDTDFRGQQKLYIETGSLKMNLLLE